MTSVWLTTLALWLGTPGMVSGPQPGDRPLPFTSNQVTGPHRGKQYCYVCELKDEPAVLVFVRKLDEPTTRLVRSLRDAVKEHKSEKLFAWTVLLTPTDTAAEESGERDAYRWAQANDLTRLPLSVFPDPDGPPGYRILPEARVTVLLFRRGKIIANHAFGSDWSSRKVDAVLKDLPKLLASS